MQHINTNQNQIDTEQRRWERTSEKEILNEKICTSNANFFLFLLWNPINYKMMCFSLCPFEIVVRFAQKCWLCNVRACIDWRIEAITYRPDYRSINARWLINQCPMNIQRLIKNILRKQTFTFGLKYILMKIRMSLLICRFLIGTKVCI